MRFNQLSRCMPDVTPRMLTTQFRELEEDCLMVRTAYAEVPPRVEYSVSDLGRSLEPVVQSLKAWGSQHLHLFQPGASAEL